MKGFIDTYPLAFAASQWETLGDFYSKPHFYFPDPDFLPVSPSVL